MLVQEQPKPPCKYALLLLGVKSSFIQSRFATCPLGFFKVRTWPQVFGDRASLRNCHFMAHGKFCQSWWMGMQELYFLIYFFSPFTCTHVYSEHQTFFWKILIAVMGTTGLHVDKAQNLAAFTRHGKPSGLGAGGHICLCPDSPRGDGARLHLGNLDVLRLLSHPSLFMPIN